MKCIPTRYGVAIMIFWSTYMNYMYRSGFSLQIVAMVRDTTKSGNKSSSECFTPKAKPSTNQTKKIDDDLFEWSETTQSWLLGGFFYGYFVLCLPAGILCQKFGPWQVNFWSAVVMTVFNALTPLSSSIHWGGVMGCRVIIGASAAMTYPCLNVLMARWAPPDEKGLFMFALMGNCIGTVITWQLIPPLVSAFGWQSSFYGISILMILYFIGWWFLVSDSPEYHKYTSEDEKEYIRVKMEGRVSSKNKVAPYLKICLSLPVWAMIVAQIGNLFMFTLLQSLVPKLLSQVMGFNLKSSGFLSALPNLTRFFTSFIYGMIGDYLIRNSLMKKTWIRKMSVIFSHVVAGTCIFLMMVTGCGWKGAVSLLVAQQALNGFVVIGHLVNCQDLSPNFAGALYSLHSFIGGTAGFIVPAIHGVFVKDGNTIANWKKSFILNGVVGIAAGVFFIIFGTSEVQSFNEIPAAA